MHFYYVWIDKFLLSNNEAQTMQIFVECNNLVSDIYI